MKTKLPAQSGILADVPRAASYLFLSRKAGIRSSQALKVLRALAQKVDGDQTVMGCSAMLLNALGRPVAGLRAFPAFAQAKVDLPNTQSDLVLWVRGDDPGEVFHLARQWQHLAAPVYEVDSHWSAFRHKAGNDLTGFEDGTENPKGRAGVAAALVASGPFAGASFLAIQPWVHQFEKFDTLNPAERNQVIGRDLTTNEELDDAPPTAHVKRTAQEDFTPEAFVLRRSMPWANGGTAGLMFTAFGASFDAFEAQLAKMSGAQDGIVDALFTISRPVGGGFYWCPPLSPVDAAVSVGGLKLP